MFVTLVWTADSNQEGAWFGTCVGTAGDVNGDGYSDVLVSAQRFDDEGRVSLYHGGVSGLAAVPEWTGESEQEDSDFGYSCAAAGDVNGDSYDDVVVGAPFYDVGVGAIDNDGRAYVFLGSAAGLEPTPTWTGQGDREAWFGRSVSSAGDVNGDGFDDLVVGAPRAGATPDGAAIVFFGSSTGPESVSAWSAVSEPFDHFGWSVSTAGDVNADGYGDVIVGAHLADSGAGEAYIYLGSTAGLETLPAWTAGSGQDDAEFGWSVSTAGDVDSDGFDDVVVSALYYDNVDSDDGKVYLFRGDATGVESAAAWTAESNQELSLFGVQVASGGDVNADGYGDVLVGASEYDNGETDEGRALLYLGSPVGLAIDPAWTAESDQESALMGRVGTAGDVNGDGLGDVVVGVPWYDDGEVDEGRAYLFLGTCDPAFDEDADTIGDTCDKCPGFDDTDDVDVDGVPAGCDLCPTIADPSQDDEDANGLGDACQPCPVGIEDADADGACADEDCDESNATVYPGAPELCDGLDNACSGTVPPGELDGDDDGHPPCAGDCDDDDPARSPVALEICNDIDDDCDGRLEPSEIDDDGDLVTECNGDCDDANTLRNATLVDVCGDGIDNNCDGVSDETCPPATPTGCDGCNGAPVTGSTFLGLVVALAAALRTNRAAPRPSCAGRRDPIRSSGP